MMSWVYLIALLVSIGGLAFIDYRYKLALWAQPKQTISVIGAGIVIFSIWDLLGIHYDIFYHGLSRYALPFRLVPDFPLEELFFLTLLCYLTLLLYRGVTR